MSQQIEFMFKQAVNALQNGNIKYAESVLLGILKSNPKFFPALHVMGLCKAISEDHANALFYFQKASKINAADPGLQYNFAKAYSALERHEEAIEHHIQATRLTPLNSEAWLNYGKSLSCLKRYPEAIQCYTECLRLNPNYFEAYINIGMVFISQGEYSKAFESCQQAIKLKQDSYEAWVKFAEVLLGLFRYTESLTAAQRAIDLDGSRSEAYVLAGICSTEMHQFESALIFFESALAINPNEKYLLGRIIGLKRQIGSWEGLDPLVQLLINSIKQGKRVSSPGTTLILKDALDIQKLTAEIWVQDKFSWVKQRRIDRKPIVNRKIRLAYFSSDFREHPVGDLMQKVIGLHDRSQFHLIGFFLNHKTGDEVEKNIEGAFNESINISSLSDQEAINIIDSHCIDIAVDLNGHTEGNRLQLFAERIAPIQVNYLGYAGTMGCNFYDYIIADQYVIPVDRQDKFNEAVAYMPDCFFPAAPFDLISKNEMFPTRSSQGLPENGFVFACFNNFFKISPSIFKVWMRLLNAVPNSVLWMSSSRPETVENFKRHALAEGVSPDRLIFANRLQSKIEHMMRIRNADIFLDTPCYNAHTTAAEFLSVGVPVLTIRGDTFSGRVAGSQLHALGLPELIADSEEDYFSKALHLATCPPELDEINKKLKSLQSCNSLFDIVKNVKSLESLYLRMLSQ